MVGNVPQPLGASQDVRRTTPRALRRAPADNPRIIKQAHDAEAGRRVVLVNPKWTVKHVVGPDGAPFTRGDLPKDCSRWTARRKAAIVMALQNGLITLEELCERYGMTPEEYVEWSLAFDRSGVRGLCTTRIRKRA